MKIARNEGSLKTQKDYLKFPNFRKRAGWIVFNLSFYFYCIFHVGLEIFKYPGISQKIGPNPKKSRDSGIFRFVIFCDKNPKIPGFGIPEKSHPAATSDSRTSGDRKDGHFGDHCLPSCQVNRNGAGFGVCALQYRGWPINWENSPDRTQGCETVCQIPWGCRQ